MAEHEDAVVRQFDQQEYGFVAEACRLFEVDDLAQIHQAYPPHAAPQDDQDTPAHALFYRSFARLEPLYWRLIAREVLPLFDDDLCVQAVPTFRVSMPGGQAVAAFHRDSDYHHQPGTVNFWLPLTEAFGTNTIWLETGPGSQQFSPIELKPGEYLQFNAIDLMHGNRTNTTGLSRVSFDFRVIPRSCFQANGMRTVSSGLRLDVGGYYRLVQNGR